MDHPYETNETMKLPRWLVIGMLTTCVLAVLAAAGWWWISWPERTVRTFLCLVEERRFEDATQLLVPQKKLGASGEVVLVGGSRDAQIILGILAGQASGEIDSDGQSAKIDPTASFHESDECRLETKRRGIVDVFAARGEFRLVRWGEWASAGWVFRVQRGQIDLEGFASGRGRIQSAPEFLFLRPAPAFRRAGSGLGPAVIPP